ncbi:unnamed protein product, partial [Allacma fusca]
VTLKFYAKDSKKTVMADIGEEAQGASADTASMGSRRSGRVNKGVPPERIGMVRYWHTRGKGNVKQPLEPIASTPNPDVDNDSITKLGMSLSGLHVSGQSANASAASSKVSSTFTVRRQK